MRNRILASVCGAFLLTACSTTALKPVQNEVSSAAEAGETHIAVLSVEPWSNVVGDLSADFKFDESAALEGALPRLSAYEEKMLDRFAAALNLGLPSTSTEVERVKNLETGEETGKEIYRETPGEAPGTDAVPAFDGNRSAADQPGIPEETRNKVFDNNDPVLRYQAANALFQYVNVLQRLVKNTPKFEDYTPFLVTFQITSFPYARHQPYDIYLDMSFYPSINRKATGSVGRYQDIQNHLTPIVVPVLITDNLQAQSVSRAAEQIRQFKFAVDALTGGIGASLGLNSSNERSGSVFGTDYTSTFSVGKTSENAITAVLGAAVNPVSDFAMIRRTHNVSTLIFVPDAALEATDQFADGFKVENGRSGSVTDCERIGTSDRYACATADFPLERRIQVVNTVSLRRPDKVEPALPIVGRNHKGSLERAQTKLATYGILHNLEKCLAKEENSGTSLGALIRTVPLSNYKKLADTLGKCEDIQSLSEFIYHILVEVYSESPGPRTTTIVLPKKPAPKKPNLSIASLSDRISAFDNQATGKMMVEVSGVSGNAPKNLTARVSVITDGGEEVTSVAESISVKGGKLVATFPSLLGNGVTSKQKLAGTMTLRYQNSSTWASQVFTDLIYQGKPASKKAQSGSSSNNSTTVTVSHNGEVEVETTQKTN